MNDMKKIINNHLLNPQKANNQTAQISTQVVRDDVQTAQESNQSEQGTNQATQESNQVKIPDIQPRPFADYQVAEEEPLADDK